MFLTGTLQHPAATPPETARSSGRGVSPANHAEWIRRSIQPAAPVPTPNIRHVTPKRMVGAFQPKGTGVPALGGQYSGLTDAQQAAATPAASVVAFAPA